jgi:hypothetical protein
MVARTRYSILLWLFGLFAALGVLRAVEPNPPVPKTSGNESGDTSRQTKLNPAIKPKALADYTLKGLSYLVNQQDSDGGWGQGGGWRQGTQGGRIEGKHVKDPPDVGNTCAASLALIRAGNTPKEGPFADNLTKAFSFICDHVEKADADSLYVTDVRDTQLQRKIGAYTDTFLTALVLSELKGQMANSRDEARLLAALNKTIAKIERNQNKDGTFSGNNGWASVLSQSVCTKALNRAAQSGITVKRETLDRDFNQAVASLDVKSGEFKLARDVGGVGKSADGTSLVVTGSGAATISGAFRSSDRPAIASSPAAAAVPSDAGVAIYGGATTVSRIQDRANTGDQTAEHARKVLADAKASEKDKSEAKSELDQLAVVAEAEKSAVDGVIRRLDDKQFLAGFGNNGGEEFLSYMNLSETLLVKGGTDWLRWNKGISENLQRVQNQDGSWSGQHCITGRTFCTAAALLTLMADRAPVPVAETLKGHK